MTLHFSVLCLYRVCSVVPGAVLALISIYMYTRTLNNEGVLLRNSSAAPFCNHFAVVTPMSRIRELVPFLI